MISKQSNTQPVLPNFIKTVLLAVTAATSVSVFAGDHEEGEKIGELKDMKKKEAVLHDNKVNSPLMPETKNAADIDNSNDQLLNAAREIKAISAEE